MTTQKRQIATDKIIVTTEFPTIKTERLLLRQFSDSDLENVFNGLSHPEIIKYYGVIFQTLEATKEQMVFFADLEKNETGIWFAVCSADNKTFYGAGGLNNLSKKHKKAEIGFWLISDFWGQGIMKEAMLLICNYGFDSLELHRIEGFVESENKNCKNAIRTYAKAKAGCSNSCRMYASKNPCLS